MKKTSLNIIILICALISISKADNTFRYSYSQFEYFNDGEIIITNKPTSNDTALSFFVKPNWSEAAEVLYSWSGIKRSNAKGVSIGSANIICSYPLTNSILSLWQEENRLFLSYIDASLSTQSMSEISLDWKPYFKINAKWIGRTDENEYAILINQSLFLCQIHSKNELTVKLISSDVINCLSLYSERTNYPYKLLFLVYREGSGLIQFLGKDNVEKFTARIPIADEVFLYQFGDQAAILSSSKTYPNAQLKIIDPDKGIIAESWIESAGDRIVFGRNQYSKTIYYLQSDGSSYSLKHFDLKSTNAKSILPVTEIPRELIEPMGLWIQNRTIYAVFRNGLSTFDEEGKLLSVDFFPFGEYFNNKPKLSNIDNKLLLSTSNSSIILSKQEHELWYINRFFANFGRILFPMILIILIIIIYNLYRYQKRLLLAVLNLPAAGAVFIIDKYGRLTKANSSGKKLLGITDSIPLRKIFRFYCELEHTKPITELVDKAITTRDTFTQKVNIVRNLDMNEWYFSVIPLRNTAGLFRGFVLTGIDITEQLERKRLSNWAQLAHDMQTNLSTIRLNAEQLDLEDHPVNSDRRKKIIHQVSLLIQRVRDVVTVGRSDSLNKELVDAFDICNEVRSEFDEALFPHVKFFVNAQHFNLLCDKPKTIRAVRNAVENGIKSMQGKPGSITINNWNDTKYVYIGIQDTGMGMDETTKKKMLTPYFTTAKVSGGAGIGTMIMQHVMELHGGEILVNSEKGKGTQIVFSIPNYAHNKTSRAIAEKATSNRVDN